MLTVPWSSQPPQPAQEDQSGLAPWTWIDGIVVVLGAFLIYIVGTIALELVDRSFGHRNPGFWLIPASYLWLTFGAFFMAYVWLVVRRGASWTQIGFRLPPGRSVGRSVWRFLAVAGAGYVITIFGTAIIVNLLQHTSFHVRSNVKELLPQGQSYVTVGQFITLIALAGFLAPITEETLFRGVLYQSFVASIGRTWNRAAGIVISVVVVGVVFGLFHLIGGAGELYTLPVLALLGVILCCAFEAADSLGGSMLLHCLVNLVSVLGYYGSHLK